VGKIEFPHLVGGEEGDGVGAAAVAHLPCRSSSSHKSPHFALAPLFMLAKLA
jgi:hypothetical protein